MAGVKVITVEILMTRLNRRREVVDRLYKEFRTIEGTGTYWAEENKNRGEKFNPNSIGQWIYINNKKWYKDDTINYELIKEPIEDTELTEL